MSWSDSGKQKVTIVLRGETLRKASALAARRSMPLGAFLAERLDVLITDDDVYETARGQALALLETGLRLGGRIEASRDEFHER